MTDTSEPQRCAECDCEDGDCNWIAPAPDTSRVAVEELLDAPLNIERICEMARVCRALLAEREALREAMKQVLGMAAQGCDAPNAAYRWCERIEEVAVHGAQPEYEEWAWKEGATAAKGEGA